MGYKHRQDGTPDHVNSEYSNSVTTPNLSASDTTTAVDTVALKKRINTSKAKVDITTEMGEDPDNVGVAGQKGSILDRYFSQKDSLNKARSGKIPAKP